MFRLKLRRPMRQFFGIFFFIFLFLISKSSYAQEPACLSSASTQQTPKVKSKLKDLVAKHQREGFKSWLTEDLKFVNDFKDQFDFMISSLDKSITSKEYSKQLTEEFAKFSALLKLKKEFPLRYEEMLNISFHFVVLNDLKYLPETTANASSINDYIHLNIAELKASYEEVKNVANEIGLELKFLPYHKAVGYESLNRSFVSGLGLLLLTDVRSKIDNVDMAPSIALRHDFDHFFSSVDLTMGAVLGLTDVNFKTRYVGDLESRKAIWAEMRSSFIELFQKMEQITDTRERDRVEILFFYLIHEGNLYFPRNMQKYVFKKILFGIEGDLVINLLHYDSTDFDFAKLVRIMEKEIPEKYKGTMDEWTDALEFIYENYAPEINEAFDLDRNWKRNIPTSVPAT